MLLHFRCTGTTAREVVGEANHNSSRKSAFGADWKFLGTISFPHPGVKHLFGYTIPAHNSIRSPGPGYVLHFAVYSLLPLTLSGFLHQALHVLQTRGPAASMLMLDRCRPCRELFFRSNSLCGSICHHLHLIPREKDFFCKPNGSKPCSITGKTSTIWKSLN